MWICVFLWQSSIFLETVQFIFTAFCLYVLSNQFFSWISSGVEDFSEAASLAMLYLSFAIGNHQHLISLPQKILSRWYLKSDSIPFVIENYYVYFSATHNDILLLLHEIFHTYPPHWNFPLKTTVIFFHVLWKVTWGLSHPLLWLDSVLFNRYLQAFT